MFIIDIYIVDIYVEKQHVIYIYIYNFFMTL